jgi:hypothetical protein
MEDVHMQNKCVSTKTVTDFKATKCIIKQSIMVGNAKVAGPICLMCKGGWLHSVGYRQLCKAVVSQFLVILGGMH